MKQKIYLLLIALLPLTVLAESVPTGSGTLEDPFNAAAANAYAKSLAADVVTETDFYVKGVVSSIKNEFTTRYGNATFYISDDGKSDSETFYVYRTLYLGNREYQEGDRQIALGDEVVICGKLVYYQGATPETKEKQSYIYSLHEAEDTYVRVDNIYYRLYKDNTAEVTDGILNYTGDIIIPATITYEDVTYTVNAIANNAFADDNGVTSISIPATITKVGVGAFTDCGGLTAVHITDIASWCDITFENRFDNPLYYAHRLYLNDEELTELVIPTGVSSVANFAFYGCTSLTSVSMSDDVTSIGLAAFHDCTNLSSVYMTNSVTTIGGAAFSGCSSLTDLSLSSSLTSIFDYTFANCEKLGQIVIPQNVSSIGENAFKGCTNVTDIFCMPETVPTIGANSFEEVLYTSATLFVPGISLASYMDATTWKNFADIIPIAGTEVAEGSGTKDDPFNPYAAILYVKKLGADVVSDEEIYVKGTICYIKDEFTTRYGNATFQISGYGAKAADLFTAYRTLYVGNRNFVNGDEQIAIGDEVVICGKVKWYQGLIPETVERASYIYSLNGHTATVSEPTGSGTSTDPYNAAAANAYIRSLSPNVVSTDEVYVKGKICAINNEFDVFDNSATFYLSDDGTTTGDLFFAYRTQYLGGRNFTNGDQQITVGDDVVVRGKVILYQGGLPETYEYNSHIHSLNGIMLADIDGISYAINTYTNTAEVLNGVTAYSGEVAIPSSITDDGQTYSVTSIGSTAFSGCSGLTAVTIPSTIGNIGEQAFFGCDALTTITSNIEEPTAIYNVFPGTVLTTATLYVPYLKKAVYQAIVGWRDFSNIEESPGGDVITITARNYEREYGDENPTFEYEVAGGTADGGNAIVTCEATANSPVGTYPIVVGRGDVANTYATFIEGTLTITKAPLTVTAQSCSKKQGEDNPAFELIYTGWKLTDDVSVLTALPVAATDATKDSPAGEYAITVSGGSAQNYSFVYVGGTLTIEETSGIASIVGDCKPFDVYTVNGIKVRHQVTTLEGLPKGLCIINGKKVNR